MSWTQAAGFSSVPWTEKVYAISPGGRIAGSWPRFSPPLSYNRPHAFVASSASDPAPVDLGTLGGFDSHAFGVNDAGTVVGSSSISDSAQTHAFVWTPAGGMLDMGTLGGVNSVAYGINASGVVVGNADAATGGYAFRWTRAGGMVDLGALGTGNFSVATAISTTGQIVGYSQVDSIGGPTHAFSWTQSGGMVDLGALPGSAESGATAVSDSGQIVGNSGGVPFTWTQSEGMSPLPVLGSDTRTTGVNTSGWIVGDWIDAERKLHGIIWRPSGSQPIAPSSLHLAKDITYGIPVTGLDVSGSRTVFIGGYGEPGATVTLYRDGAAVGGLTIDRAASSWSIGDSVPADGTFAYSAKLTVAGADSSVGPALAVTVDTTGPGITVHGAPNGVYDLSSIPARPTITAADARGVTSTNDTWVTPTSSTGVGDYTYTAYAQDGLDNQSSATRTYTVRYGSSYRSGPTTIAYGLGSTIPLRFTLGGGAPIASAGATLSAHVGDTAASATYERAAPAADRFRYDTATKQYAFDLDTAHGYVNSDGTRIARFQPGSYTLAIALDDGTTRIVHVRLTSTAVAIGRAQTSFRHPRAGTRFAVAFAVTKPGTRATVAGGRMTMTVRIAKRAIRHSGSYRAGKARTSFSVPRGSRGKLLTITLTMHVGGSVAKRFVAFRIR